MQGGAEAVREGLINPFITGSNPVLATILETTMAKINKRKWLRPVSSDVGKESTLHLFLQNDGGNWINGGLCIRDCSRSITIDLGVWTSDSKDRNKTIEEHIEALESIQTYCEIAVNWLLDEQYKWQNNHDTQT